MYPAYNTSFAGTSSVVLSQEMELSQDMAQFSIGAATVLGYDTNSMRVTGRDGSHYRLVMILAGGQVSQFYEFVDTTCSSAKPDY